MVGITYFHTCVISENQVLKQANPSTVEFPVIGNAETIYEQTRYKLVLRMCLLFSILISMVALLNLAKPRYTIVPDLFAVSLCLSAYFIIRKTKKYRTVGLIAAIGSLIIILTVLFAVDAIHYTTPMWMVVHVMFTFIVLQKICGLVSLLINFTALFIYVYFFLPGNLRAFGDFDRYDAFLYVIEFAILAVAIGYTLYVFINATKRSETQLMYINSTLNDKNALISRQKAEMEVMLKEIHHRVKNNLQIISSLLRLQARSEQVSEESVYHEAVNRISAMAIIHEKMYQDTTLSDFNVEQYIESLLDSLFQNYAVERKISTKVRVNIQSLSSKSLVPVAMLLNELVSNSIKHAFVGNDSPAIEIVLADLMEDQFMIEYFDNGKWKEGDANSFGLEIIDAMTAQLDGTKTRRSNDDGTFYIFLLNKLK